MRDEQVPHVGCIRVVDKFGPSRAWVIQYPVDDWYVSLSRRRHKLLVADPGSVQLRVVAEDSDRVVIEAGLQLGPLAARLEFQHSNVDADPLEIVGVGFGSNSIVLMREVADVELASPQRPCCHAKS